MEVTKKEKLKQITNENGMLQILAIDHRDLYADGLSKRLGHIVSNQEVMDSKNRIIEELKEKASCILIDPVWGITGGKVSASLKDIPFMVGIENNNYKLEEFGENYLYSDISVEKIKKLGGSVIKLFVFYHPDFHVADKIDVMLEEVSLECKKYSMPLLLEPILTFPGKRPDQKEVLELTIRMLKRLSKIPVDIYKLEYPGQVNDWSEEENIKACKMVDELISVPWIILTSGVPIDDFKKQLKCACKAGACGYAAGRSVWFDYIHEEDMTKLDQVKKNLDEMNEIVNRYGAAYK